ncbi:MAG: flagellar biosynthetic protein FliO [Geminicoccaceae bacterium]
MMLDGAEPLALARAAAALVAVLLLGLAALWLARRAGMMPAAGRGPGGRLVVVAARAVDARSRLLLVRRDDVEHLLAVTPAGITLLETLPVGSARPELPA